MKKFSVELYRPTTYRVAEGARQRHTHHDYETVEVEADRFEGEGPLIKFQNVIEKKRPERLEYKDVITYSAHFVVSITECG